MKRSTHKAMQCICIGFGTVARIHQEALNQLGVQTLGVVETNPQRVKDIWGAGLRPLDSLAQAITLKPDFFDICTPTRFHAQVLKEISALAPHANVLIEKPICDFKDIELVSSILAQHQGHVVINENYCSSNITQAVRDELAARSLRPTRLIVEMTKHRGRDYLDGRFLDKSLGALGYEGSHLLALVGEFGEGFIDGETLDIDIDSIHLNADQGPAPSAEKIVKSRTGKSISLSHQGGAFLQYRATNGCLVDLYTSLSGIIGFPCPPYAYPGQRLAQEDTATRYRILRVDGIDPMGITHQVVGFFEPIVGLPRARGTVLIFRDWELVHQTDLIADDTMRQHMHRAVQCFSGQGPNPYSAQRALHDVRRLHAWSEQGWSDMDDSDDVLGSEVIAAARISDARRFTLRDH